MKRLILFFAFLFSWAARADTLTDLKATLRTFTAKQPVRASYERRGTNTARGRFYDGDFNTSSVAEVRVDGDGLTLSYARALLDRGRAEQVARLRGAGGDPKAATVGGVSPLRVAEMLDYAPSLAAILERAQIIDSKPVSYHGQPVNVVNLRLTQVKQPGVKEGHVKSTEDRLTVWLGADGAPVAAERISTSTAGILFLHADLSARESWTFARRDDRLVIVRYQRDDNSSGMGQTSHGMDVETITLR